MQRAVGALKTAKKQLERGMMDASHPQRTPYRRRGGSRVTDFSTSETMPVFTSQLTCSGAPSYGGTRS